jgi:hypothetical protein
MIAWIAGLVAHTAGGISDLAADVVRKLLALWNTITGFFGKVRSFLSTLRAWLMSWLRVIEGWALSGYNTARWIITTWVPKLVADAITQLRKALLIAVDLARTYARQLVDTVTRWARLAIGALTQALADLRAWILARVADAFTQLARLNHWAFSVLGTAERITAFILAPMIKALGRWIMDHIDTIVRNGYKAFAQALLAAAQLVEGLLARMI